LQPVSVKPNKCDIVSMQNHARSSSFNLLIF
jgi:hypothetical protein